MDGTCSDYRSALHIFAHSRYFQMHYDHNQIISDYIYHHTVHPYSVAFCAWVLLEPSGLSSTVGGIAGSQLCGKFSVAQEAWFDNDQKVRHRCGLSTAKCVSPAPSSNLAGWILKCAASALHMTCTDTNIIHCIV